MFQAREPQESLWQSEFLITPRKAKLMRRSWAEVFRNEALVLIEEERFAPMYCWQPAKVAHFETREIMGWMEVWRAP